MKNKSTKNAQVGQKRGLTEPKPFDFKTNKRMKLIDESEIKGDEYKPLW